MHYPRKTECLVAYLAGPHLARAELCGLDSPVKTHPRMKPADLNRMIIATRKVLTGLLQLQYDSGP